MQTNTKNILLVVIAINQYVDDKFSKPFKTYLGKDTVYNFINRLIEESKCCSDVMKKIFFLKTVMTKEGN